MRQRPHTQSLVSRNNEYGTEIVTSKQRSATKDIEYISPPTADQIRSIEEQKYREKFPSINQTGTVR